MEKEIAQRQSRDVVSRGIFIGVRFVPTIQRRNTIALLERLPDLLLILRCPPE
jgi:hypothetical protein